MSILSLPEDIKRLYPFTDQESKYIEVEGGHKMHYIDSGNGLPVLMVHGHPTWSFYYRNLIQFLKKDFRCIAVDHLGCGLSDKPQDYPYLLENHIDNLVKLVETLNLKKFNLVVHDWGGAIGMGMAERLQDRVGRIIVLNTGAFRSQRIPLRISVCRIPLLGEFLVRGLNIFVRAANYMASVKPLTKGVKKAYIFPFSSWRNRIASYRFVKDIPMNQNHSSYSMLKKVEEDLLKLKEKPMMICWGSKDFCFNDHFYEEWKRRFPDAETHYFENAGHYVLEDAIEHISELAESFFATTQS